MVVDLKPNYSRYAGYGDVFDANSTQGKWCAANFPSDPEHSKCMRKASGFFDTNVGLHADPWTVIGRNARGLPSSSGAIVDAAKASASTAKAAISSSAANSGTSPFTTSSSPTGTIPSAYSTAHSATKLPLIAGLGLAVAAFFMLRK